MSEPNGAIEEIVIVGGGTAGWLTAGLLAANWQQDPRPGQRITLIESPDIPTVGVGEGTWPSMLETLKSIGLTESQFLTECDGSFKQGSRFINWTGAGGQHYDHPFTLPADFGRTNLAEHWLAKGGPMPFAQAVSPQSAVCDRYLAPKQFTAPEYAFTLNHGYHLDAGKFVRLLRRHCVEQLGVGHQLGEVTGIATHDDGNIRCLHLKSGEQVSGDLFIDCTGMAARLLAQHYQVPWVSYRDYLFNDSALAVQVPYNNEEDPIASMTLSTAHESGWIWDIGLPYRRGVGAVFSSAHSDEASIYRTLENYLKDSGGAALGDLNPRRIDFEPGHRTEFWSHNCVAIGLSAGFVEPLEATALVLVERSAQFLVQQMPENREQLPLVRRRFNRDFRRHWDNIIDFLKLHYALTDRRDSDYWRAHADPESWPESLREQLTLWRSRSPWLCDSQYRNELFPAASYQYVLYGMQPGYTNPAPVACRVKRGAEAARAAFLQVHHKTSQYLGGLPGNRELLRQIRSQQLHTV